MRFHDDEDDGVLDDMTLEDRVVIVGDLETMRASLRQQAAGVARIDLTDASPDRAFAIGAYCATLLALAEKTARRAGRGFGGQWPHDRIDGTLREAREATVPATSAAGAIEALLRAADAVEHALACCAQAVEARGMLTDEDITVWLAD